jgi:hypothetical protein
MEAGNLENHKTMDGCTDKVLGHRWTSLGNNLHDESAIKNDEKHS